MNELKVTVDVPMWYETKGISRVRVDGPHMVGDGMLGQTKVFRLSAWITRYPEGEDIPDFYAEMDHGSLINLRNALSAALFTAER
jgi:hypothetical protein